MSFHRARYVPLGTAAPPTTEKEEDGNDAIAVIADWAATKAVDAAAAVLDYGGEEDGEEEEDNTAIWAMSAAGTVFSVAMLAILGVALAGLFSKCRAAVK